MSTRLSALRAEGVDFVAGVPCSYLKAFFAGCESLPASAYLPAVREDHAVAACAGAWLAGRTPLAAMQNSGLGYCLEVLSSLQQLYAMPLPMLVSDRGEPSDYEEHHGIGQRARRMLELFEIPWQRAVPGHEADEARWLVRTAIEQARPAVLLVPQEADS